MQYTKNYREFVGPVAIMLLTQFKDVFHGRWFIRSGIYRNVPFMLDNCGRFHWFEDINGIQRWTTVLDNTKMEFPMTDGMIDRVLLDDSNFPIIPNEYEKVNAYEIILERSSKLSNLNF